MKPVTEVKECACHDGRRMTYGSVQLRDCTHETNITLYVLTNKIK